MRVHFFYDWSGELSTDGEGGLVQLCDHCAWKQGDAVHKAQRGDLESECELCDASNDPARSARLDAVIARLSGRA